MKASRVLSTIDTHTAGGPTRIVLAGLPPLRGDTVTEKMEYFREHFDPVRRLLMLEPRGHKDMSGAVLTDASHPDADLGAFFLTAGGYLRACVHSSIGLVTAGLETGFIPLPENGDGRVRLETPAGIAVLAPELEGGRIRSVAMETPPAFIHTRGAALELGASGSIETTLAFSGVFFVLVDVGQPGLDAPAIAPEHAREFSALGVRILEAANETFEVRHPEDPSVHSIELVMFYREIERGHGRDIVVSRSGAIDRSPCGAGTGAKVAHLLARGELELEEEYVNESFLGTRFIGQGLRHADVRLYRGVVPRIRGSAFVTGMHQFVLDPNDPLSEGFVF